MVKVNHTAIERVKNDFERFKQYVTKAPMQAHFSIPRHPLDSDHSRIENNDFVSAGNRIGVEPLEFKHLLIEALESDDEVVVDALKKFLLIAKMRLPEENNKIEWARKQISTYQSQLTVVERQQADSDLQFNKDHNVWQLQCQKYEQDLTFYMDDLVKTSIDAVANSKANVWQGLVVLCFTNSEQPDQNNWDFYTSHAFGEKVAVFEKKIPNLHDRLMHESYEKLVDKFFVEFDKTTPFVLDGDDFIAYFDDDEDDDDGRWHDWSNYERAMSMRDSRVRFRANEAAAKVILDRISSGVDGYDGPTYGLHYYA